MMPQIEGRDVDGVFTLRNVPDAEKIKAFLKDLLVKNVLMTAQRFRWGQGRVLNDIAHSIYTQLDRVCLRNVNTS